MAEIVPVTLRELVGNYSLVMVGPFGELEAGVAAATKLRLAGSVFADAGDPVMPTSGWVVGITAASETGSNFTLQFTKNGTANTVNTVTVNSAAEYETFEPIAFDAGDTIGLTAVADTTSKDAHGWVWVVLDWSAKEY